MNEEESRAMIKVVIADDILILRRGLQALLSQDAEIEVTGLAADGREALEACRAGHPDVVLMDMRMPGYDGGWGIRHIKEEFPEIRVLVLTTFDDRETVDAAIAAGADGYILKEMEDGQVIQSVKAVCAGMRIFGGSVFEGMRRQMTPRTKPQQTDAGTAAVIAGLTERELEIMRCVAQGMDNREIAGTLYLAEGTVRNHISRILEKLKLKDRTQLAVFTVKNRLE